MILRLLRKLLVAESIGLILVFAALGTMTYGISASLNGVDSRSLLRVCFVGVVLSLGLAKIKLNGITASVVMTILGFVGIWILGAGLARSLIELVVSFVAIGPHVFPEISYRFTVDASRLVNAWQTVLTASTALSMRLHTWSVSLGTDHVVSDPLIRNLIWVLAFWFLSVWIGWFSAKRSAIAALLPAIILMAEVTSYSKVRIDSLWLIVFILLLLMGVWNYRNTTAKWEQQKVDYSESIRFDNSQAVVLLSVVIGLIAFITPSVSWRDVREYLQRHQQKQKGETPAEILGIKQPPSKPKTNSTQTPSLPREHWLSGGFAQSPDVVMTIRTGELAPVPFSTIPVQIPRHYWRSVIYDEYQGAGWITSPAPAQSYKADTPLIAGVLEEYRPLHLDVQIQQTEGRLFWSGVLYSADTPFRADWRVRPESGPFPDQTALLQADIFQAATAATSYSVQSYVPDVTIQELNSAPTEYPADIQNRYLQLPQELPDRVHQLATQITEEKTNPYEKAKAIEAYLRKNYPYDLNIPAPPKDKDVADYFLFDLKRGYCDYYATAMVVMARSVGLPARFVSGYASGDYDAEHARYIIRELHAHSWVEVYFPNIGWIEFEPTASQPEIVRPAKNLNLITPQKQETNFSRLLFQLTNTKWIYWLSPVVVGFIVLVLYYAVLENLLFLVLRPSSAIEQLYRRYYRLGRPLVGQPMMSETAYEFTDKLISKLEELYVGSNNRSLPDVKRSVAQLTNVYQLSLFSKHQVHRKDIKIAVQLWKQVRRSLILSRIRYFFQAKSNLIKNKLTRLSFKST